MSVEMVDRPRTLRTCAVVGTAEYDPDDDPSPSTAVIDALAQAADEEQTDLPSLYDAVAPDALNRLVGGRGDGVAADALAQFTVDNWTMFVRGDGQIRVCDSTRPIEPTPVFGTDDSFSSDQPS